MASVAVVRQAAVLPLEVEKSSDAPAIAPRRMRASAGLLNGGYSGASHSRRALREWTPWAGGPNGDTIPDLPTLRARSRDLERNAPLATGALGTLTTTTIGTGLRPHARIDRDLLGLTDDEADAWERQAERLYWAHFGTKSCDLAGRTDGAGLQELILRSALTSGDVLPIRRYKKRPGDIFGLKFQIVEADRIANPNFTMDSDRLMGGVELDEDGRAVAYHVTNRHPGEWLTMRALTWERVAADGAKTGDLQAALVMRPMRAAQVRGVPILAPVIELLKQLTRYTDAELMATVLNSFFTVFVKTEGDEAASGLPSLETTQVAEDTRQGSEAIGMGQGSVVDLMPGEEIQVADPKRPNANFDPFLLAILRQIGVAVDLPFEFLVKHFTASYSASQAALLEAWRAVSTRRAWLVRDYCQWSYESLITEAVAAGRLNAPGYFDDPLVRRAWLGTQWTGPARGQINPVQEVTAAQMRVDGGFSTIAEETAQLTGGDWETNHRQQVKEHRARVRDGLAQGETAPSAVADPETQDTADAQEQRAPAPPRRAVPDSRATVRQVVASETARALTGELDEVTP